MDGTTNPATGTDNPAIYGYDFGLQSGKGILVGGGEALECSPLGLHNRVPADAIVVAEASFGSYGTNEDFNALLALLGPRLRKLSNRAVKNYKTEHGLAHKDKNLPDDGAHVEDAEILVKIVQEQPARLGRFKPRKGTGKDKSAQHIANDKERAELHKFLNEMRHKDGWGEAKAWFKANGWKAAAVKSAQLAAYGTARFVLSRNPNSGRADFDRLLGWHDHAYPTMSRGHAMHYLPKKYKGRDSRSKRKEYLQAIRKEARHIFAKLKGTSYPATGTVDPFSGDGGHP